MYERERESENEREKGKNRTESMNAIGGTLVTQCQYTWLYIAKGKNDGQERKSKIENKRTHLHGESVGHDFCLPYYY